MPRMPRSAYGGYGIGASALGTECDRQIWLTLRWASPQEVPTGRQLRIFERGDIEEERVLADRRRAGVELGREQERFALASGWLRGKVDAVGRGFLEAPKAEHVIEIKSMKAADWRAVQKHGVAKAKPELWHRLHAGMAALGIARGAYVAVNKDTGRSLVERVRLDVKEANRQEARVERLVAEHEAPLKIAEMPSARRAGSAGARRSVSRRRCPGGTAVPACTSPSAATGTGTALASTSRARRSASRKARTARRTCSCPALVPVEQIDADLEAETVTYRIATAPSGPTALPRLQHDRGPAGPLGQFGRAERELRLCRRQCRAGAVAAENQVRGRAMMAARNSTRRDWWRWCSATHRRPRFSTSRSEPGRRRASDERRRLPDRRRNTIRDIAFGGQAFTVCVGYDDAGRPLEVFADGQKTGSTMAAFIDDACIAISIALQHGIAPAALVRSLSTVQVWANGVKGEGQASPVGAILAALEPAAAMPWAE